jgi:NRPS condensation-like uncharacterized protein
MNKSTAEKLNLCPDGAKNLRKWDVLSTKDFEFSKLRDIAKKEGATVTELFLHTLGRCDGLYYKAHQWECREKVSFDIVIGLRNRQTQGKKDIIFRNMLHNEIAYVPTNPDGKDNLKRIVEETNEIREGNRHYASWELCKV